MKLAETFSLLPVLTMIAITLKEISKQQAMKHQAL
jgi:hypothetical protein